MRRTGFIVLACATLAGVTLVCGACGDDAPGAPGSLTATGSLTNIALAWGAADGAPTGYAVYRGTDGATFTKVADLGAAATGWNDPVASPAGDGVFYWYRVAATRDGEEGAPTAAVRQMHGTRVPAVNNAVFATVAGQSPYVVEGAAVANADFTVAVGTRLYVLPGASLSLSNTRYLYVNGTFQALGEPGAPAVLTSHKTGGLGDGEGLRLQFSGVAGYNAVARTGTLLRHALVTNLAQGNAVWITSGGGLVTNCRFSSTRTTGGSAFVVDGTGTPNALTVTRSSFSRMMLNVNRLMKDLSFSFAGNRLRGGYYAIAFFLCASAVLDAGQVAGNDFDGTKQCYLYEITGSLDVPLAGNYWAGGSGGTPLPAVLKGGTAVSANPAFMPALTAAPAACGATW